MIHVPDWPGRGAAQAVITCRNAVSARTVNPPCRIRLSERARHVQFIGHEDHAGVRTPPEDGFAFVEPRETAARVRLQQTWHRQPSAGREEAVRPPQCALDWRQRIVRAAATGCSSLHYAGFSTGLEPGKEPIDALDDVGKVGTIATLNFGRRPPVEADLIEGAPHILPVDVALADVLPVESSGRCGPS